MPGAGFSQVHVVGVHHHIKITTWAQNNWLNYDVFGNRERGFEMFGSSTPPHAVPGSGHTVKVDAFFTSLRFEAAKAFRGRLKIRRHTRTRSSSAHFGTPGFPGVHDILSIVQIFPCFHLVNSASQTLCACRVVKHLSTIAEFCHFAGILPAFCFWAPLDTSMFNTSASQQLNL